MDGDLTVEAINQMVDEQFPGSSGRCLEIGPDYAIAYTDVADTSIRPDMPR